MVSRRDRGGWSPRSSLFSRSKLFRKLFRRVVFNFDEALHYPRIWKWLASSKVSSIMSMLHASHYESPFMRNFFSLGRIIAWFLMFFVSYPCAFLCSSHVQHSFSSDGLQTLNSHCDMYTITKTIAEVTACTGHKQVKKKRLGLLLYSREHAGATRNLEADLTTCDRKVRAIKTLMSEA